MSAISTIEQELNDYLTGSVEISDGVFHSQYKLYRRINLFKSRTYPTGKLDEQGRYKYWFDIITPRVNGEVKNLRIDTKNWLLYSYAPTQDFAPVFIANGRLDEWMWEHNQADELNMNAEAFSADGNVIFKKVKGGYETTDPANTFVVNQTAKYIEDSAVVERHELTQSQLRAKDGLWMNVDEVIEECGDRSFKAGLDTTDKATTSPFYEIFERNGEISEKELFEAQGKEGGDENKFILAKVIVAGLQKGQEEHKYVLFADKLSQFPYKAAHRGAYKGRFWREGLVELLMDHQTRANEIGNQLARALEWSSKILFTGNDNVLAENILTDLRNGDYLKGDNIRQLEVRLQGADQLIADWNRVLEDADRIANSFEVVQGDTLPSGTAFRLGFLMDKNANKLFVLLRQKFTNPYRAVFKEWVLPDVIKDIKGQDIIRITGDADFINRFREIAVEQWYAKNLAKIGPHTREMAKVIKAQKLEELKNAEPLVKNMKEIWEGVLSRLQVTVVGENLDLDVEIETLASMVQLETDPVRRAYLLDRAYARVGIPVPPMTPQQPQQQAPQQTAQIPQQPEAQMV